MSAGQSRRLSLRATLSFLACAAGAAFGHLLVEAGRSSPGSPRASENAAGQTSRRHPLLSVPEISAGRRLALSETKIDLDDLQMGQTATASLDVINSGSLPVTFKVLSRCGCVRTRLIPDVRSLEPSGSTRLEITLRMANHVGVFRESVRVVPLTTGQRPLRVDISGVVIGGIQISNTRIPPLTIGQSHVVQIELQGSLDLEPWRPVAVHAWSANRPELRSPGCNPD